ncbi:hypothetical protein AWM68_02015 [Fictibacillus phosphorivorans]|uniref:Uncharacterized protein n=1 Tax=Fictibacillus phosphorivorans TaxID=1221500 RepID=A0A161TIP9_9BACL|nr:DUF6518 family protein [Fictibacillus phosphorivorans]KZE69064.1 hypothetical protein AWM68_02015 [Fictibacillus phosphorivorans]
MNNQLQQIRPVTTKSKSLPQKAISSLLVFLLGSFFGFIAKFVDGTTIGLIGTDLGIWILITTMIAAWSRSPNAAALHAFIFLASMLMVYYMYSTILFGFFPSRIFLGWGIMALFSPIGGYAVWFARGKGWLAALSASLPISLLIVQGYPYLYTFIPSRGFDLLAALLLIMLLPKTGLQRLRILPFTAAWTLLIERLGLLYMLPV